MRIMLGLLIVALTYWPDPANAYLIRDCRTSSQWSSQTSLVHDINPGPADAANILFGFTQRGGVMAAYKGALFVQADNGQAGAELWRVAADAPPQIVSDLAPGPTGSKPHAFAVFQGRLYFAATTDTTGEELFRYDGNAITLAADLTPGPDGGEIHALTLFAGKLYFIRTGQNGDEMWSFDGTTAQPVTAINNSPGKIESSSLTQRAMVSFKGRLFYVRRGGVADHFQLWSYNQLFPMKVASLVPANEITEYSFDLGVYNDALYFGKVAGSPGNLTDELWKFNGQGAPVKVASLGSAYSFSQPGDFQVFKGKLYFGSGSRFHETDGVALQDPGAGPGGPPTSARHLSAFPAADQMFLTGYRDEWTGREPYIFNGSVATMLHNIMPDGSSPYGGSFPTSAVAVGNALYFYAKDADHGRELWQVKGEHGPVLLHCDIVVAPIWDDWRKWVVDQREIIVSTWLVQPRQRAQLLSRENVLARRDQETRVRVLEIDTRRRSLPEGALLATIVYDRETGDVLDRGFEAIGSPARQTSPTVRRLAADLIGKRTLRETLAERVTQPRN
ncbi:MAG: hypothetical protein M3Q42_13555 [Pseudomonadota bacterium]|nr:hypothetical protein [Pseudomonadota bacterium]